VRHRGAYVSAPSLPAIIDNFRVRRLIEPQAVANAQRRHPALGEAQKAVDEEVAAAQEDDWGRVAVAEEALHRSLFALVDSSRLNRLYEQLALELLLASSQIVDRAQLYAPLIERNVRSWELCVLNVVPFRVIACRENWLIRGKLSLDTTMHAVEQICNYRRAMFGGLYAIAKLLAWCLVTIPEARVGSRMRKLS